MIDLRGLTNSSPDCAACESPCAKPKNRQLLPDYVPCRIDFRVAPKSKKIVSVREFHQDDAAQAAPLAKKKKKKQKTSTKRPKALLQHAKMSHRIKPRKIENEKQDLLPPDMRSQNRIRAMIPRHIREHLQLGTLASRQALSQKEP